MDRVIADLLSVSINVLTSSLAVTPQNSRKQTGRATYTARKCSGHVLRATAFPDESIDIDLWFVVFHPV